MYREVGAAQKDGAMCLGHISEGAGNMPPNIHEGRYYERRPNMGKYDVAALGELLIDFAKKDVSVTGNPMFEANPGGAPCNVLAMLQKLGRKTAFIGKVGSDFLGDFLANTVKEQGIDVTGLSRDAKVPTTLAFVNNTPDGDRSFSFYRSPGADMMLGKEDVDVSILDDARIFHFGTLSMTDPDVELATKFAVEYAKRAGKIISFDPNLREPLWDDLARAKEKMEYGMSVCDILKISDNEIEFVTGEKDIEAGVEMIKEKFAPKLICATLGRDGSIALYGDCKVKEAGFIQENTVDTTGAGDTFMACVLNYVCENGLDGLAESQLRDMLVFANAAASIITTRVGALRSMPEKYEVEKLIAGRAASGVKEVQITLGTIDRVKRFVAVISPIDADFAIKNEKYIVDAKSIMGIFSMDLSKPLKLEIDAPSEKIDEILSVISEFTE